MKHPPPIVHFHLLNSSIEKTHLIQKEKFTAGKHPTCDLVLVSIYCNRTHASFCWKSKKLFVMDENSVNGVFINQNKIDRNEFFQLKSGDKILLGDLLFEVHFEEKQPL